ncbi:hypothetical protein BC831DRAFT_457538 [Entophlyctis helioformis]|nr:hypothetical protein BC831DRAFT_457538 [Entophlyctis helioformis]
MDPSNMYMAGAFGGAVGLLKEHDHKNHITDVGTYILWATFAVMAIAAIAFAVLMFQSPAEKRGLPMIVFSAAVISALAYFAMAASEGLIVNDELSYRTTYLARYIDWALTFPLLLSILGYIAGASLSSFMVLLFFSEITVLTALFGSLDRTDFRWAWFAFWLLFWIPVIKELVYDVRIAAQRRSEHNARLYDTLVVWVLFLMTLYPVFWALTQGSNVISVDGEITAYALLDVSLKVVLGVTVLSSLSTIEPYHYSPIYLPRDSEDGPGGEAVPPQAGRGGGIGAGARSFGSGIDGSGVGVGN